ncbi:hypothetical protein CDV36_004322 [Fusarium kuroshium]|uniref:Uncharacterized protein n=1 Tax=Fusarium kuroshium TaxID=2010991 RepID=A0A3M2SEL9_9HYPO|nr:hypothetical protein CDV36_004322 [Fusarium kuroshium]
MPDQPSQPGQSAADLWLQLDMAFTGDGTPMTPHFKQEGLKRGNITRPIINKVRYNRNPLNEIGLWVGDLPIEPQTVAAFFSFVSGGRLPEGRQTILPLATKEEVTNMTKPYSQWAPAEYHHLGQAAVTSISSRINLTEDDEKLPSIATELYAMKKRIWEGIPPLSERRWKDLDLDNMGNFPMACRYIVAVIDVFQYLNEGWMRKAMRTIYNRIWDDLHDCEEAINACRRLAADGDDFEEISLTALWYQHTKSHFDSMCQIAHEWVIEHIQRLRQPVLDHLASHQPTHERDHDEVQWDLTNKLYDLLDNGAHADFTIFLPMEGYKGSNIPLQRPLGSTPPGGFREKPISFSVNILKRKCDYGGRLRYLTRKEQYGTYERLGLSPISLEINDPARLMITCHSQIDAQTQSRRELRGVPQELELDPWLDLGKTYLGYGNLRCGFVAYRLCHSHTPEVWNNFKAKFESDISDWGRGVKSIDDVRAACKIYWLDGQDLEIPDGDIEAAKKHFHKHIDSEDARGAHKGAFLVIDEDVVKSYLNPVREREKFVLAVDPDFDPETKPEDRRLPSYKGSVRVLGSILWDDLGALLVTQSILLDDTWALAMSHPHEVYEGARVTTVLKFSSFEQLQGFDMLCAVIPKLVPTVKTGLTLERLHRLRQGRS